MRRPQVEEAYGEPLYAQRHRELARKTMEKIVARYWDAKRGVFSDTPGEATVSEHAQMFALLTGLLDADKTKSCLAAMRKGMDRMATISASYYALEALYQNSESDEFFKRLEYWRGLPAMGFTATPEAPEPTRSDSHPWGAHPLYHTAASIAGRAARWSCVFKGAHRADAGADRAFRNEGGPSEGICRRDLQEVGWEKRIHREFAGRHQW